MIAAFLSFAVGLGGPPAVATAEPPLVELHWQAPADCPDATAVHAAIASLVPEHPLHTDAPPRIDAKIDHEPAGFVLRLQLAAKTGSRSRELRARACASLVDAVAMEVALLIEAERVAAIADETDHDAASESAPPVPPTTTRSPPSVEMTTTSLVIPPPARPRWRLRAGALVGARVVEGTFAAPTIGVATVGRRWAVELDLAHWPRGFVALPARSAEGSRISLTTVTVTGCGRWARGRFALAGCGGIELGALAARGIGLTGSRSTAEPSLAFVVIPHVDVAVHRLVVISLGPWFRASAVRPGVRVDGVGVLYRAAPWSFGGVLRLEVAIPARRAVKTIPGRNDGRRGM